MRRIMILSLGVLGAIFVVVGATFPLTAHAAAENKTGGVTSAGTVYPTRSR